MAFCNVIDKLVEPITKKIFPPDQNPYEAPNYMEFHRRKANSAFTALNFIVKAVMVLFSFLMLISFFFGR
jgi:hypothetical protein